MLADLSPTLTPADAERRVETLTDGDPAFGDALRMMLWGVYAEAGQPLGADEDAMLAWWAFGQGTTTQ